jgi:hypothetical protein
MLTIANEFWEILAGYSGEFRRLLAMIGSRKTVLLRNDGTFSRRLCEHPVDRPETPPPCETENRSKVRCGPHGRTQMSLGTKADSESDETGGALTSVVGTFLGKGKTF